ncbi:magnesium-transporting ATPase [Corynebacterium sp. 13CS0277]|uniref:HAD-IC family P-type ATPase n=1 Tax=Corynebacterium sp. 13CS0277 TaxID=2071994 RepID=UPI000D03F723|nr:HAD-IC family P-type ATPase [Corynebacterium sp. 13CS0277]PRQ11006.1 magnesium-transporting ATPase [Corynebacterium sp. 13CS0277]
MSLATPLTLTQDTPTGGLTPPEVAVRRAQGKANVTSRRTGRTAGEIIRANLFTRINAILGVLFACVMVTGSIVNGAFGLLIIVNSAVGIVQELRAKRTLDKLSILAASPAVVLREGARQEIPQEGLVVDDLVVVAAGDQVVVDGVVRQAQGLDVDESMLTGESLPVHKYPGDTVWSGSFVTSGSGTYQAVAVGADSYQAKLVEEAGKFQLADSELRRGIDKILRVITWLLVPVGLLTIWVQLTETGAPLHRAILAMVAALVPMVPEGLVLMTSVAFAVGVVRLGKRKALVNELPAIEGLARVDVVCADKTGTLTENTMHLARIIPADGASEEQVRQVVAAIAAADEAPNDTMRALLQGTTGADHGVTAECVRPFDPAVKFSSWRLQPAVDGPGESLPAGVGAGQMVVLGAPDVLLGACPLGERAQAIAAEGLRVLALGLVPEDSAWARESDPRRPESFAGLQVDTPLALCVVEQTIRSDAAETIEYFRREGVEVKIISGDNAVSVGAVARAVGVDGEVIDARELPEAAAAPEEFADIIDRARVFGRVTPEQKRDMVRALDARGHTVAMTGDGINDVLALKEAAIGVSMGSGAAATRSVAQLVLLNNSFASLPQVVREGRRVIGNIERIANLFLTKTVYSIVLALVVGLATMNFPFQPIHVTVAGWFTIGIPGFILSLAPNAERARPGFASRVLRLALPSGVIIGSVTVVLWLLINPGADAPEAALLQASTATFAALIIMGVWVLGVVARPWNGWRAALVAACGGAYVVIFFYHPLARVLKLDTGDHRLMLLGLVAGAAGAALIEAAWWIGKAIGARRGTPAA